MSSTNQLAKITRRVLMQGLKLLFGLSNSSFILFVFEIQVSFSNINYLDISNSIFQLRFD